MPKPPDFDQIAELLLRGLPDAFLYRGASVDSAIPVVVDALRQVWNARGAADIEQWILTNVDERVVPEDEGHGDALKYNLIHLLRDGPGYRRFEYAADQEAEIASWEPPARNLET